MLGRVLLALFLCSGRLVTPVQFYDDTEKDTEETIGVGRSFSDFPLREYDCDPNSPTQIHIVLSGQPNSVVVSWINFNTTAISESTSIMSKVIYGFSEDQLTMVSTSVPYIFDGLEPPSRVIHNVMLSDLYPLTVIYYQCIIYDITNTSDGIITGLSPLMKLIMPDLEGINGMPLTFAVYGDFGVEYANPNIKSSVYSALWESSQKGEIQFTLHIGDIAYDLNTNNGSVGDLFMEYIQPLSSFVPYMTAIGCHERDDRYVVHKNVSYGQYLNRFSGLSHLVGLSHSSSLHYYSWDAGPIHFLSLDLDPYEYNLKYTNMYPVLFDQWDWLKQDLSQLNQSFTQWIIVYAHRSLYCSKDDSSEECLRESDRIKSGIIDPRNKQLNFGLEDIFHEYGVDLVLSGHTHVYERTYPVYKGQTIQTNFINCTAPVYVVNGVAGVTGFDLFNDTAPEWSAYRDLSYRNMFGYIQFSSDFTHLTYQARDVNNQVFDQFVITK